VRFFGRDLNLYAYMKSAPVGGIDPSGLAQLCSRPLDTKIGDNIYRADAGVLDKANREPEHEQFFFSDDGSNVGFFGDSTIGPDKKFGPQDYACEGRQYDDDTLRRAVKDVGHPGPYSLLGDTFFDKLFGVGQNNCQDWTDEVLAEYERLRAEEARDTGVDPEEEFVWQRLLN
jgi:hypothetical protein